MSLYVIASPVRDAAILKTGMVIVLAPNTLTHSMLRKLRAVLGEHAVWVSRWQS